MITNTITTAFQFPQDYELPVEGGIEIKVRNITDRKSPITHSVWGSNRLPTESPWRFTFNIDPKQTEAGAMFAINVSINHQGVALLLDIEHTFRWGGGDQEVDIDLSPVGYIAIKKTFMPMIGYPVDSKLFVKLLEGTAEGVPEVVVSEAVGLTAAPRPFYLRYNPIMVKPGQRYKLKGSFETHGRKLLTLGLNPKELVLMPEQMQSPAFGS